MTLQIEKKRRDRNAKQAADMRAAKEQEIDEIIIKACKRYAGAKHVGDWMDATNEEKIEALDTYIFDLRQIILDLQARYGPGLDKGRTARVRLEIDKAIEGVAKLMLELAEPKDARHLAQEREKEKELQDRVGKAADRAVKQHFNQGAP